MEGVIAQDRAQAANPRPRRSPGALLFSRTGALAGYGLAAIGLVACWVMRERLPITAEEGLGYALGIVGGSLMLILLLYSVRKRVRFLRHFGKTKYWFRIHMMLGIVGPLLILYHSNFSVGSLNSQIALYCTLLVAGSGILGRYLYAQIHQGLYGRKASLKQLTANLESSMERISGRSGLIDQVRTELLTVSEQVMRRPDSFAESLWRPIAMGVYTRWLYHRLSWSARKELTARSLTSPAVDEHREQLLNATRNFLREHLTQARQVAQFGFYERLFSWWHIVHVPFFMMMVLSAIVHVFAVHMY